MTSSASASPNCLPNLSRLTTSAILALIVLATAGAAAWLTRDAPLFSLMPPGGSAADIPAALRTDLHFTFFSIWGALLLAAPAVALIWFARRFAHAHQLWRTCWTAALMVFLVHFYWAVAVIFDNDWTRILHTSRVSAPILDTVFAGWWVVDVCLAWSLSTDRTWVRVQRAGVHLLACVLFFMGAAREGELILSRGLGWVFGATAATGLAAWLIWRLRRERSAHPSR